jgi:hypothetical protein
VVLNLEDARAVDRPELGLFNGVETAATRAQAPQVVTARTKMQRDLFVPMGAIGRSPRRFVHDNRPCFFVATRRLSIGRARSRCPFGEEARRSSDNGAPALVWR